MNTLHGQLVNAYLREEKLYAEVAGLVARQAQAMEAGGDVRDVFAVCRRVEELMDGIADVEQAIHPAKAAWEATRDDPDGALNAVLGRIERSIAEIAGLQERVQQMLLDHMRRQKEAADAAQASVNASRAQRLYKAG